MSRRTFKLVLLSVLAVGTIGSVTVRGVYGVFSTRTTNGGASISSGTLTMENTANGGTACRSLDGTSNVNTGCDSVFTYSAAAENYPSTPATASVEIKDSGSLGMSDLQVYMPSCLRGVTADAPFAAATTSISSFTGASTTGGHLAGGTTYYYEVTAVTGSGESIAGSESSYTPPAGTTTNQVTLDWPAVSGATGYKIYRSTSEGGEQLLATLGAVTSYADTSATVPSGSPPSGTGSGNPCLTGGAQLYVQETSSSGTDTKCWYPTTGTSCTFDGIFDLGLFALSHTTVGTALDLGAGPNATQARYFEIGLLLPAAAGNALQGTEAAFTLRWYAQS
ncbi:MAG TPA: hypothetical protein VE088_00440 [Gaiellaceae bacterium]|nr:hypothetical protein [Gaiellaceae bacterium]